MDPKPEQLPQLPRSQGQQQRIVTIQGEGDYAAARRYRDEVHNFVAHEDVEELARRAKPASDAEAHDLILAEEQGRSRSRGDDAADVAIMNSGVKSAVSDEPDGHG